MQLMRKIEKLEKKLSKATTKKARNILLCNMDDVITNVPTKSQSELKMASKQLTIANKAMPKDITSDVVNDITFHHDISMGHEVMTEKGYDLSL